MIAAAVFADKFASLMQTAGDRGRLATASNHLAAGRRVHIFS